MGDGFLAIASAGGRKELSPLYTYEYCTYTVVLALVLLFPALVSTKVGTTNFSRVLYGMISPLRTVLYDI